MEKYRNWQDTLFLLGLHFTLRNSYAVFFLHFTVKRALKVKFQYHVSPLNQEIKIKRSTCNAYHLVTAEHATRGACFSPRLSSASLSWISGPRAVFFFGRDGPRRCTSIGSLAPQDVYVGLLVTRTPATFSLSVADNARRDRCRWEVISRAHQAFTARTAPVLLYRGGGSLAKLTSDAAWGSVMSGKVFGIDCWLWLWLYNIL